MINAATLAVKLQANTRGLQRDLRQAERSIQRSGTRMGAIATRIGAALGTALLAAGAASVNAASDVEELESKAKAVFGSLTRDVEVWAEATAEATGRSKFAFIDFASTLQDTLVPMGLARSEAAEVSMQLSELAVDLSSFANVGSDQALNALQSALVGNGRAMKQFGVIVNQTTTEQELLKQGIEGGIDAATEQEKVLARLGVVMAGTADAQGDAARTANEFANQRRALGAEVRELAVEIGEELLPAATELVGILTSLTGAIKDAGVSLVGLSVAGGALYTITRGLTKANAAAQALQATMMANPGVMGFATPPGKGNVFLEPKTLKKSMSATKAATGITQKLIATFGVLFLKVTAVVAVVAAAFFVYKRLTKGTGELTESVNDLAKAYGVLGDEAEDAGDKNNRVVPQALLEDSKQAAENITALREEIEKLRALRDRGVGGGNTVTGFSSPVGAQRDLDRRLEQLDTAEETVDAIGRRIEGVSEARMFDGLLGTDLTAIEDDAVALLRTQQDATDVLGTLNRALAQNARQREEATDPAFRAALERDREAIESLRDSVAGFVEELIGMDVADFGSLADLEDQLDGIERKLENTTQQSELISLTREQVRLTGEIEDGERRIAEARVDARRDMPKTVQLLEDQIKDLETLEATADDVGEARFFRRARENARTTWKHWKRAFWPSMIILSASSLALRSPWTKIRWTALSAYWLEKRRSQAMSLAAAACRTEAQVLSR